MKHITVLKTEGVAALRLKTNSVVVDATHGSGGHALAICQQLGTEGIYIGLDADATALETSPLKEGGGIKPTVHLVHDNYSNLTTALCTLKIEKVDGILADLGWRTEQFESGGKGFSFRVDEPLHMTYGAPADYLFTATDIVNGWDEEDIANVIYGYGEDRQSRRIAKAIVTARKIKAITSTLELASIINASIPKRFQSHRLHPATKTFQALRIAVNDELKALETFLAQAVTHLNPNGSLAIISFHSLEDRIVKLFFKELVSNGDFTLQSKKPIEPTPEEVLSNPRSRSAKLRSITYTPN